MMKRTIKKRIVRAIPLAAFSLGAIGMSGCTREFFRQWANQDTTEAVFEKSRDPRFRLDMFSIEPPAMSRFADPFDPDHPPAPPDDIAAEALSPVPQTPRARLITPIEGTGYLAMLDEWARDKPVAGSIEDSQIMMEPRVPDLRPEPRVPNDPETPQQTIEENRAYRGENSRYPKPSINVPNEIGPNPSVPDQPRQIPPVPGTPSAPANPGSGTSSAKGYVAPYIISQKNHGTTAPGVSPKEVDLHPGQSPAQVAQSGQRATQATSSGVGRSGKIASRTDENSQSGQLAFMKPGNEAVVLDTVSPERRRMVSQFSASEKTGIPLPTFQSVEKPRTDTQVLRTQATTEAPQASGEQPANRIPEPLDIQNPLNVDVNAPPTGGEVTDSTTKLLEILNPKVKDLDMQLAAGLPRGSSVYIITPDQAMTLALINSRDYQSRIENIYRTALPVTLQRFNLEPQVFAGLSPTSGTAAGGSPANFANSFLYRTLEAPGGQSSVLSQGQVAGVGKVFMSGASVVTAFASQTVFNLTGSNPIQPNVQSVIPISIVQPFLRSGGRAVTLEDLTQTERNLLYEVRAFARYRQDFVVKTMLGAAGGSSANLAIVGGGSTAVGTDPTVGYMPLLQNLMVIENNRNQVANFETVLALQEEQVGGEGSGLTQLQVDQTNSQLQNARVSLLRSQVQFRNLLDQYKQQMGLPPDTPIMPDLELINAYRKFLRELRAWSVRRDRELAELDVIAGRLPDLEELDVRVDDRSILDVIIAEKFDEEEALLNAAVRVAMENRLDLMNARAQLYDAWRQIRVRANALKGVFDVTVRNQVFTSPLDSNPFAFLSDAKQFNLVLNAELPLVRVNERNNFRLALIGYQQQRRALMKAEDDLKRTIRQEIRQLQLTYQEYEIGKRQLILSFRQRDQSQEQLFAPPGQGGATDTAVTVNNLNNATNQLNNSANQLVNNYVTFLGLRLQLFRDLGIMPYDEWEAYYELFAPKSVYSARWDGSDAAAGEPAAFGEPVQ